MTNRDKDLLEVLYLFLEQNEAKLREEYEEVREGLEAMNHPMTYPQFCVTMFTGFMEDKQVNITSQLN
jgi:hypothetical protein